ncbi:hypothetical protein F4808DRAFT_26180 [Astrocystis sublimbata]|nr:hypothetical protein F4808DRAFT_26180 [Astrocystis sublimbata]
MFLHSGASLHGHEFSKRASQVVVSPINRRNPLLRSNLSSNGNRLSIISTESSLSRDDEAVSDLRISKRSQPCAVQAPETTLADSQEATGDLPVSQVGITSEDGTSSIPDAERRTPVLVREKRQSTFVLAHPPPKLRTKQKIIHMRPNLVLQVQQVTPGLRPRPAIDVYPSFAGAGPIMAPLLGRVPRMAGIKRELSGQDIMLFRSEDYASQTLGSESDGEEDGIVTRDLLAVFSPSRTDDKTEIVMADGMVWTASTRSLGSSFSYEFTSVSPHGTSITARWVRKQVVAESLPTTPTSPHPPSPVKPKFSDTKFTFSFIDKHCRRHPILATLASTSLTINETYVTIPQSQSISPNSSSGGGQTLPAKRIKAVEEWQKSFITISAVWVALRHGWAPDCRPEDFMFRALGASPTDGCEQGRRRSLSLNAAATPTARLSDPTGRPKYSAGMRQNAWKAANDLPRRATSTGAAFIQKRRAAALRSMEDERNCDERERTTKLNRRALSGDWNLGLPKRVRDSSLAGSPMSSAPATPMSELGPRQILGSACSFIPRSPSLPKSPVIQKKRRAVSAYLPLGPLSTEPYEYDALNLDDAAAIATSKSLERGDGSEAGSKAKHRKWRHVANWFRKISTR